MVLTRGVKLRSEHPGSLLVRPSKGHAYGRLLRQQLTAAISKFIALCLLHVPLLLQLLA